MNIGIVTTWFERGASYVSKIYADALSKEGNNVFIYARAGVDHPSKKEEKWNGKNVIRDEKYYSFNVDFKKMSNWIKKNHIQNILFNEQQDFRILVKVKRKFPQVVLGAYVDYYKENTLPWFRIYDYVICNTHRHMQAMDNHPQKIYVKWGSDVNLFNNDNAHQFEGEPVFFHSVGMSPRKGTDVLLNAYINGELYKKSKLVIHTQIPIEQVSKYSEKDLEPYGIKVIHKTVTAPGLYHLGDVYVYPTKLDGLGLTMYEALACGLPVITTDFPPMNEAINSKVGRLVKVADFYCRSDAYYYPMAICDEKSLIKAMEYYIEHPEDLAKQKRAAREYALENYDISKKSKEISQAICEAKNLGLDASTANSIESWYKDNKPSLKFRLHDNRKMDKFIKVFIYRLILKNLVSIKKALLRR